MKKLNVLTIGNSFADSVFAFLPGIVENEDGVSLDLDKANIGGCSLQRHWNEHTASLADPSHKAYSSNWTTFFSLAEKLSSASWDVVTIQQASHESWRPESYHPYAEKIIGLIRELSPKSEIIIQQTWAYRADDPRLGKNGSWNISQSEMYRRLTKNYTELAKKHGFRVIPSGLAVQIERAESPVKFKKYDPRLLETLRWPDLPRQAGDTVGALRWTKNSEGRLVISPDCIHLNERGRYMQASLWFGMLFGRDPETIRFTPSTVDDIDAAFLRKCASRALREFKQVRQELKGTLK